MSKELKPVAWLCTNEGDCSVNAAVNEFQRDDYKRFGRKIEPLYTQSQLDAQSAELRDTKLSNESLKMRLKDAHYNFAALSAYIEEMSGYLAKIKPVLQTIAMDRGKGSKADVLFNELLALLNQSPTTSLEQVKRDAITDEIEWLRDNFQPYDEDEHMAHQRIDATLINYANNLKEKG